MIQSGHEIKAKDLGKMTTIERLCLIGRPSIALRPKSIAHSSRTKVAWRLRSPSSWYPVASLAIPSRQKSFVSWQILFPQLARLWKQVPELAR